MIYALKLENDKYYIGYSSKIQERITSHFAGGGGSWTKLHKPISVIETREGDKNDERLLTISYMIKYGWQNVRGAGWTAVELNGMPRCLDAPLRGAATEGRGPEGQ